MKLHLNLSLRRALLAAMAVATTLASSAWAGVADSRYDLQYYLDFCRNKGIFAAGATNIDVYFKDGSSVQNPTIPIMPNLDGYAWSGSVLQDGVFAPGGGVGLVNPQYVASAHHCGELNVYFLSENADTSVCYTSSGYTSSGSLTYDWNAQRLNKIVTEVTYNPLADYSVLQNLSKNDWIYRLGNGGVFSTDGYKLSVNQNAIGGMVNVDYTQLLSDGETWRIVCTPRENDVSGDIRPPLEIGVTAGDSGSPNYVWDDESQQFLFLGFISQGNPIANYGAFLWAHSNPAAVLNFIDSYTDAVSGFSADSTIVWGAQSATTGQGALTQGNLSFTYTGKGTDNTIKDTRGLLFDAGDAANRTIELQGSVDMGAGSLTFNSGSWTLTEKNAADTFNSAGFVVNAGAELILKLTATAGEEWRKVGEGTMTISGEGANDAILRVGGGTTKYDVSYDEDGNIIGCALGNIGETRLNRTGGYAASSVRLEAGSAIIVLMQDGQFKTNSVAGDTFTFGNAGGLLNLNGHDLTWGVINQDGSGVGARIGNKTPLGETTPGLSTFTYTGTGTFAGCFVDEGAGSSAQLAVVYNNAGGGTWKLTGNNSNVGGYTVEKGTLVLEGYNTPHVNMRDAHDWSYATLEGSDVTVKSGATFQLSHHALMTGDVIVEDGGSFVMNQAVNADSESIQGSLRQNMVGREITSLVGNVTLHGNTSTMTANVQSSAITKLEGSVSVADDYNWDVTPKTQLVKDGNGILVVTGNVNVPGVQINAGGLVIESADRTNWYYWSIGEQGFLAAKGVEHSDALVHITKDSAGVFALTKDQSSQLNLSRHTNLYIGAWGDVSYGAANTTETLTAYNKKWLLGGGTGTLTLNFRLTGENDLIIGNDYSSGTVHLTNTQNDFSGEIIIKGSGNKLTFEQGALSANAGVTLTYGNALSLYDASQLAIVRNAMEGAQGVLALATSDALNMGSSLLSLGADGDFTYTGALSVDSTYRFGGSGNLTVDTALDGTKKMEIDGQGTTGSSVTFARENAFSGAIVAGAGLGLAEQNSTGDISIHVGHADALAAAASVQLQKGAVLHTDGNNITVQNLSAAAGSSIRNDGATNSMLALSVTSGVETSIADGVLDGAGIHLLKTGEGALTLAANRSWSGGLTIAEGTVKGRVYADSSNIMVGIGSEGSSIYVDKDGVLELNFRGAATIGGDKAVSSGRLNTTLLPQKVAGTGTIRISAGDNGGTVLFSDLNAGFAGTMELVDKTRLYIGHQLFESIMNQKVSYNNVAVFNKATIDVKSGSQVRLTNQWIYGPVNAAAVVSEADFIIAGTGFAGADDRTYGNQNNTLATGGLTSGALSIDLGSVINGTVTLADHATIASHSHIVTNQTNQFAGYMYGQVTYGLPEGKLGGTLRGQILGEGKDLTFAGEEGMTITADSANTYRNLIIASSNGHRKDDKFALNLDGGQAVSQTSTALGKGEVTLGDNLILRLAGTGKANNADVVYTYANDMNVGENATLQSHNITNVLTGKVTMQGDSLNLATSKGGVLHLAGGVQGCGTLNIGEASKVILGSESQTRTTAPQFSGTVAAGAGADITLTNPTVVAADTIFNGTDSLTLRLDGTDDYFLSGVTMGASADGGDTTLTLGFDFSNASTAQYTTLSTNSIFSGNTIIDLKTNLLGDLEKGSYVLIDGSGGSLSSTFSLADDMSGRLSLDTVNGQVILTVGNDSRYFWSAAENNGKWNTTDANWKKDGISGTVVYTADSDVVLNASGLSTAGTREMISVDTTVATDRVNVSSLYGISGSGSLQGSALVVAQSGDLQLDVNATFTEGVHVNKGTLAVGNTSLTADVTIENGAEVSMSGTSVTGDIRVAKDSSMSMTGISLTGEIQGGTGGRIIAGTLDGNGNATYAAAVLSGGMGVDGKNSLTLTNGTITLNDAIRLDALSIADGKTVTIWNAKAASGADKSFGVVELGNGAVLQSNDREAVTAATTFGTLQLKGASATLQDQHHSGYYNIGSLSVGEGGSSSTLDIVKKAESTYATVVNLGNASSTAGNFRGSIALSSLTGEANDSKRSLFLVLGDSQAAAGASINMKTADSSTAILGLGINTASATIAGLESSSSLANRAKVFSGSIGTTVQWGSDNSEPGTVGTVQRSLTIDTASGHNYTFYGEVLGNLNLVKSGAGKQTFSGASTGFNGSIELQEGTLAFGTSAVGMLSSASHVLVSGGTLDLSAIDFSSGNAAISIGEGKEFTFSDGASIAFGAMDAGKTYSIFSVSGELEGWNADVLSAERVTINGTKLSEMYRSADSVTLTYGWDGSFSYTVEGANLTWQGGSNGNWDTTTSNWDITPDAAGDSTVFYQKDHVTFDGRASTKNVTLTQDVKVGNMTIDGASYNFGGAHSLDVDTLTIKGNVTTAVGNNGSAQSATVLTVHESSKVDGTLDMYWTNARLNLKGLSHEIGTVIMRGALNDASSLNINAGSAVIGHLGIWNNSSVTFGAAEGGSAAEYSIGTISLERNTGNTNRTISVQSGANVTVTDTMSVGVGHSLVVDGKLNINNLTYTAGNTTLSGSGVTTINGAANKTGGTLTVQSGELNFNGATTLDSLNVSGGTVNFGAANMTGGTLTVQSGELNFNGATTLDSLNVSGGTVNFGAANMTGGTLTVQNGELNFNGATTLDSLNVSGGAVNMAADASSISTLTRVGGTVNFLAAAGADKTTHTVNTMNGVGSGTLYVADKATLNVGSIAHGSTGGGSTYRVDGIMNVSGNADIKYGWGESITGIGKLNVENNLSLSTWGSTNIDISELNVKGNLNLGSYYMQHTLNLNGGVTSVHGAVSLSQNNGATVLNISGGELKLYGSGTLNNGQLKLNSGKLTQVAGATTIANSFSMTGGELNLEGGTMTLTSVPTVSGGAVNISGGELVLGSAEVASALLSGVAHINLTDGELDLSAGGFSAASGGIEFGTVMTVSGSGAIDLGSNLSTNVTYDIFTLKEGASLDWENMGDHILVNGTAVSRYSGASLAVTDAGVATLSFSSLEKSSVYWAGGESGAWDYDASNWDLDAADAIADNNVTFLEKDTVVFASDASVTVEDGVSVGGLTIEAGKHLTTTGAIEFGDSAVITTGAGSKWTLASGTEQELSKTQISSVAALEIGKGATLTVSESSMDGYAASNLSGEGTIELNLSATYGNTVNVGSSFKGETYVTNGHFTVTSAVVGETLRLAHGVNMQSGATATVAADLILEGESIVHANSGKHITYSGSVTGDNGVYISQASSSHTFNGTVDLKEFRTAASAAVNFNGSTTLDKASISQATVTFTGKTDITEAAISGGIANLNGTTTVSTLTQTGGKVNVNGMVEVTGKLTGSGGTLGLQSGELKLSYTKEDGNTIKLLDGSMNSSAAGTLRLAKTVGVTVAGQIWGRKDSSIVLEQGAQLVNTEDSVSVSNRGTADATFQTAKTVNDAEYSTNNTNWELTNVHLASTAAAEKTLTNKLINSSVENAGSGKLTVSNAGNTLTDIYATGGDLTVLQAATGLDLNELVVGDKLAMAAYTGTEQAEVREADVIVRTSATFGTDSKLNANLTLASGSELGVAVGGVTLGSTLTLQQGLTLDESTMKRVSSLSVGESQVLFTGVDTLRLATSATEYQELSGTNSSLLASTYFHELSSDYRLSYTVSEDYANGGTLSLTLAAIPEPTTTTLSLLALSALAMRRRRK